LCGAKGEIENGRADGPVYGTELTNGRDRLVIQQTTMIKLARAFDRSLNPSRLCCVPLACADQNE